MWLVVIIELDNLSYSILVEFLDNLVSLFILDMVGKEILEFHSLGCSNWKSMCTN